MRLSDLVPEVKLSWRAWLPVLGWIVAAVVATQWLLHSTLMDIDMLMYHVIAGLIQAALILVPAGLYLAWRQTAEREHLALEELRKSEQLREDLIAMLVHDLKNPAISSAMAIDLLLEDAEDRKWLPRSDRDLMLDARRNLGRLERMIGDMLAVSAARAGQMQLNRKTTNLCDLMSEIVQDNSQRAASEDIALSLDDECESVTMDIDRELIRRVVENLLVNAITHTPPEGRVELSVVGGSSQVVVSVSDTGEGIEEGLGDRLFEPYSRGSTSHKREHSSVGLGLAFCKAAVEAHGGRIWAESTGGGSRFSFSLPMAPTAT